MRWDRFFEDLEDQLAVEWEAERAVLDSEAERLRVARLSLRDRLVALARPGESAAQAVFDLADGLVVTGRIVAVGAEWVAAESTSVARGAYVIPLSVLRAVGLAHADVLSSAREGDAERRPTLSDRIGLGFVLRDAARRRLPVALHLAGGRTLTGTIDRAGADHLDLALHDAGAPRRAADVTGHRLVPFTALVCVRLESADLVRR